MNCSIAKGLSNGSVIKAVEQLFDTNRSNLFEDKSALLIEADAILASIGLTIKLTADDINTFNENDKGRLILNVYNISDQSFAYRQITYFWNRVPLANKYHLYGQIR
jgi:hypothetical protein